jgi:hypothetical protein
LHELAKAVVTRCARKLELRGGVEAQPGAVVELGSVASSSPVRSAEERNGEASERERAATQWLGLQSPSHMLVHGQRPHDEGDMRWPSSAAGRPLRRILKTYKIRNTTSNMRLKSKLSHSVTHKSWRFGSSRN